MDHLGIRGCNGFRFGFDQRTNPPESDHDDNTDSGTPSGTIWTGGRVARPVNGRGRPQQVVTTD